jgi:integrase
VPEIRRLLEVADDEWRSLILFGIYTGQRLGDLVSLTWANVDLERNELYLVTRKRGKRLTIPLALPLREHLLSSSSSTDDPLAPIHPRSFAILARDTRVRALSAQFGDLLVVAGLRSKLTRTSRGIGRNACRTAMGLSFHCLRHTAVSLLRDAGASEAAVMELVGHDSVEISRHYTRVGREALQRAVTSLPTI